MKIVMICMLLLIQIYPQWERLFPQPTLYDFKIVHSIDIDRIITATTGGEIFLTTNRGGSWTKVYENPGLTFLDFDFINNQTGYILPTDETLLLKTTNGGLNWTEINIPGIKKRMAIDFDNNNFGTITGWDTIFISTNGGSNWSPVSSPDCESKIDIFIPGSNTILAAADKILRSTNRGTTWTTINNPLNTTNPYLVSFVFEDSLNGYCLAYDNSIIRTTNGGATWSVLRQANVTNKRIPKLFAKDSLMIILNRDLNTTNTDISYSTNKGNTWASPQGIIDDGYQITTINIFSNNLINVGGSSGNLFSYNPRSQTKTPLSKILPYSKASGVSMLDVNRGFIISSNALLKTTDGGKNFTKLNSPAVTGIKDFEALSENNLVFITGQCIYSTTNGGTTWKDSCVNPASELLNQLCYTDNNTLYLITETKGVWKSLNGGINWTGISGNMNVKGIDFLNNNYGWITTSSNGELRRTTNGGAVWNLITSTGCYNFSMADETTGFAFDQFDGIKYTTNGGLNWHASTTTIPGEIVTDYDAVKRSNKIEMHFSTDKGFLYTSIDSGKTFNQESISQNEITKFDCVGNILLLTALPNISVYKKVFSNIPVELTSFTADVINNEVILKWNTASEINNKGFEIERSLNKFTWENIGFIKGNGTSTEKREFNFIDLSPVKGRAYYRLTQIDFNGAYNYSNILEVNTIPELYSLEQNFPNPFNPATTIQFRIPERTNVTLKLFNVTGEEVKTILNEEKEPGNYEVVLNASELTSGVYYYRITTNNFHSVKKLMLIK